MMDKRISLRESTKLLPKTDAVLALGGVTLYRRPMAFSFALMNEIQQADDRGELTLLAFTAGLESDILVGAGMITRIRTCYFGLEAFGLAPNFTEASANGRIEIVEESEASIALGLRAALAGVGFMPSLAWQGTDLLRLRPDVKDVTDPYTGETLTAFPAIPCDLAVIHALKADREGNVALGKNIGVDPELAYAANQVVVTAEEVVPHLERADIIGHFVTAVVESPGGAWPTSCHPYYGLDGEAILEYMSSVGSEEYDDFLTRWDGRLVTAPQ